MLYTELLRKLNQAVKAGNYDEAAKVVSTVRDKGERNIVLGSQSRSVVKEIRARLPK